MSYVNNINHFDFATQKNLLLLKSKIKGLAEEVKRGREWQKKEASPSPAPFWNSKRYTTMMLTKRVGEEARHYLLAYGLLRGMPYDAMEPKTEVKPKPDLILRIIHDHLPIYDKDKWTIEMIETLLDVELPEPTPDS